MEPGKRFEDKFSTSLHLLPGASHRIEDGGAVAKNQQYGDFYFFALDGHTYLIECKATKLKSFEVRKLRASQMAKLKNWERTHPKTRHSVIALNFYGDDVEKDNDCILIRYADYEYLTRKAFNTGRASIPREWLEGYGHLQERIKGNIWKLDFAALKDGR